MDGRKEKKDESKKKASVPPDLPAFSITQDSPSYRFFGARIRNHPENPPEETRIHIVDLNNDEETDEESDEEDDYLNNNEKGHRKQPTFSESTEIIFKDGRVAGLAVDKDLLDVINKDKGPRQFCPCCSDRIYDIVPELRHDIKAQARLIFKILMIENLLHLITFVMVVIQYYSRSVHDFIYEQWAVVFLLISINHITLIWSVMLSDLAAYHPADNLLLLIKAVTQSCVGMFVTSMLEWLIVLWVIHKQDFADSGNLTNLYKARANPEWRYTYPVVVPAFLFDLSMMNFVISIFFNCCRGNAKNDKMIWVALLYQILSTAAQMAIIYSGFFARKPIKLFFGPVEWDYAQFALSGSAAGAWGLWRLYNLRLLVSGMKHDVHEKCFKKGALHFCI